MKVIWHQIPFGARGTPDYRYWPSNLLDVDAFTESHLGDRVRVEPVAKCDWQEVEQLESYIKQTVKRQKSTFVVFYQQRQSRGRVLVLRLTSRKATPSGTGQPSWWKGEPAEVKPAKTKVKTVWDRLNDDE